MADIRPEALEPNAQYDPDKDLSKLERGFVDLVEIMREEFELDRPAEARQEIKMRYADVVNKNPKLVADVIDKLDSTYKSDENFRTVLESILSGNLNVKASLVSDVYCKARMLGELMLEFRDCRRAEPYLFVALKIEDLQNKEFDKDLLLSLADALSSNADPLAEDPESDKRFSPDGDIWAILQDDSQMVVIINTIVGKTENDIAMTKEQRIEVALNLLLKILAEEPDNIDVLMILAETYLRQAGLYVKTVISNYKQKFKSFSDKEIRYVEHCYEEARRYALNAIALEEEFEVYEDDYSIFTEASFKYAMFLLEVGQGKKGMLILQDLLERSQDPIGIRERVIVEMMPYFEERLKSKVNLSMDDVYIGMRNMLQNFAKEIVRMIEFELDDPPNEDVWFVYIKTLYHSGIVLLCEKSFDEVQDNIDFMREVSHPEAEEWADNLQAHLELYMLKEAENPNRS